MSRCKHEGCDNVVEGKAVWCSDRCRKAASRTQPGQITPDKSDKSDKSQPGQQPGQDTTKIKSFTVLAQGHKVTTALDHYNANPDRYVARTNPELLNYGKPMSMAALSKAGLKANRVSIPGDHDYTGVCEQVDGKWQVGAGKMRSPRSGQQWRENGSQIVTEQKQDG
jgi:hypothetical protein